MVKKKRTHFIDTTISSDKDTKIDGDVVGRDKITNVYMVNKDGSPSGQTTKDSSTSEYQPNGIKISIDPTNINQLQFVLLIIVTAIPSMLLGGVLWNILNTLLGWKFYLGGSGNEPHGLSAFIWGTVTVFPIIFFALIACIKYLYGKERILLRLSVVVLLYSILGGIGAVLFYDLGIRAIIESLQTNYGIQEISIVILWSLILTTITSTPFLLLGHFFKDVMSARLLLYQIAYAIMLSTIGVIGTLFIQKSPLEIAQFRGLITAVALRLGMFLGIVVSISRNPRKN